MTEIVKEIDGYTIIEFEKSNIYVIENIFEDNLCNEFVELIEKVPKINSVYTKGNNVISYNADIDNLLKINDDDYYPFTTDNIKLQEINEKIKNKKCIYNNDLNGLKKKDIENYKDIISKKFILIDKLMKETNKNLKLIYNSGYCFRKIYGKTRIHSDGLLEKHKKNNITFIKNNINNKEMKDSLIRSSSVIIALNDNYDGGQFHFPNQNIKHKLKKGSVIIFPPYYTHPHETTELENNTFRYTINTWTLDEL